MKFKLDCFYSINKFKRHSSCKNLLLNLFEEQENESVEIQEGYYTDNIHKLDWGQKSNWNRKWVTIFKPLLSEHFIETSSELGFQDIIFDAIWFQQYIKGGTHGWHIHNSNFTGVYYVELNENSSKTQLVDPFTQSTIITPNVTEGDILIFPSSVIHRAPKINDDKRKTIVSFNITLGLISYEVLERLK
jgi:hypothetical protein